MQHDEHPERRATTSVRTRWKALSLSAAAAGAAVVLAACGGGASSGGASASTNASAGAAAPSTALLVTSGVPATGASTPTRGGTINVAWQQEPPCLYGEWVQIGYLSQQYLEELVAAGPNGTVVPWLATSWKVGDGGRTYTFQIRRNVKFTDGTPLDAQAVVDNFKSWFSSNPSTYNGYAESEIGDVYQSAVATGPMTVQVNLKQPYYYLPSVLAQYALGIQSPKAMARGAAVECQDPVGTGPFTVAKWNHGQDVVLRRNPNYNSWPADALHKGPAYVDGVDWKFISDDTTRYASLQSGENDVVYNVPAPDWAAAKQNYQVLQYNTGGNPYRFQLATKWGPFTDVRVRRAFGYAMDRPAAVQAAYQGSREYNGNGALGASTAFYDASLTNNYAYNPAEANKLLDAAGWTKRNAQGYRTKDGQELTITLPYGLDMNATQDDVNFFQILQQEEQKVGFHLVLEPVPAATFFSSGKGWPGVPGKWNVMAWYWVGRTPDAMHVVWAPKIGGQPNVNNITGYNDPRVWPLIQKLDETSNPALRRQYSYAIQQIVVNQDALVFGISPLEVNLAITPKLHDVRVRDDVGEPVLSDAYFSK